MKIHNLAELTILIILVLIGTTKSFSQQDKEIPQPEVVKPGKNWNAPSDAIILFNGGSLENFESVKDDSNAEWNVEGDHFVVEPGTGNIHTKQHFGDCQLHIEWKAPEEAAGKEGQKSGNSGIYMMGKYEVQVLNSYENTTYPDGQAAAIYKQHPPLVNASREPGEWQVYDIVFIAPKFNADGTEKEPGYMTVFHNGVLVQYHSEIKGPTTAYNKNLPETATEGPLMLQDHNNKVSYRNIWIRKTNVLFLKLQRP